MTDGWIKHDGGPCPVAPGRLVMVNGGTDCAIPVESVVWKDVTRYRTYARVNPPDPGPSDFVRETAARIMAAEWGASVSDPRPIDMDFDDYWRFRADHIVKICIALEAALKKAGP